MDIERRYRQLQRATPARSVLDVIACVFLGCGFAFWGVAFWQLLSPPQLASLLSIQAAVLALAFSLAAPLLLSMLVPTTPAGQLLQKTQWATIGFYVILGSALFLVVQAEQLIETWLYGQPGVRELGSWRALAFVLVIAFVVIPALAWVQLTPERWVQSVQQAHAVKKLEMQQRGELAIIKASLVRAETLAAIGWANLLPLEQEEAIGSLRGLLMASSDTMRSVVRTLGLSADLERSIMGDDEIAGELEYVKSAIDVIPTADRPAIPRIVPADGTTTALAPQPDATPAAPPRGPAMAGDVAPPRTAADSSEPPRYAAELAHARAALSGVWAVSDLAETIGKSERAARDRIAAWMVYRPQLVCRQKDGSNSYYFTEHAEAR